MSTDAGIIDSFARILGIVSRKDRSTPLLYVIQSLQELMSRLESIRKRLSQRYEELMLKAIQSVERREREKVKVYASEIANVKKFMKIVSVAELAVERVIERLKTIDIVRDFRSLSSIIAILNELKMKVVNEIPELTSLIDNVVTNVNMFMASSRAQDINVNPVESSKEVEELMKEIEMEAEKRMREHVEIFLKNRNISVDKAMEVERIASEWNQSEPVKGGVSNVVDALRIPRTVEAVPTSFRHIDLEKAVLEYILKHGGVLNIDECARCLGVSRREVILALRGLERKGLIRLMR